ncbi:S-DNA-T family DNA segregation ATPase FtsK/SpoIIIE [Leucobacter luti]|uniref:S-DNA-T family DNA segregation ATPase FtsK/SpoIIIE n=2 Tax=Leucobacter luti TaxID=340320 RepID=A0A4Q7TZZ6_9MICO|nr:FtsK/SpoIIIE domain-containing protein [Leucobacter luti]MBL3698810.1 FHA domain-containing protein [Leucobacter luti]RZT66187.1 S-DNA-T family DNA segregation ATPase FtsK/SpoIIIE [Leucobacter luti]
MRILIELGETSLTAELRRVTPNTTVRELLVKLGVELGLADELFLDGARVHQNTKLRALHLVEGSGLSNREPLPPVPARGWGVAVSAGRELHGPVAVPTAGRVTVGRSPHADLRVNSAAVSWQHCTLELERDGVRIRDVGSTNGTVVEGVHIDAGGAHITSESTVLIGGAVLRVSRERAPGRPGASGATGQRTAPTTPFNRPPRPTPGFVVNPVSLPVPQEVPAAPAFNLVTVAVPFLIACVLVLTLGDLRYALFAVLSPVMAVGMQLEQRRRRAHQLRAEDERFGEELTAFRAALAAEVRSELARRRALAPDPAQMLGVPQLPSPQLWERRSESPDFLHVHLGVGDVPWRPPLAQAHPERAEPRVQRILDAVVLPAAPVIANLSNAGVIGVVGDRSTALALSRSLVVQAAVQSGPADLTVVVCCDSDRAAAWEWAGWLPQTRAPGSGPVHRWLSKDSETSDALIRALLSSFDGGAPPAVLAVIDSESLTAGRDSPARALLGLGREQRAPSPHAPSSPTQASGIVVAATADQLPAACTAVIEVRADATATVHGIGAHSPDEPVLVAGVSVREAADCARRLARFDDPELRETAGNLPGRIRLADLLGAGSIDQSFVRRRWAEAGSPSTPIGVSACGTLSIDIVADGPHGLVGGTTGSGKSEFLRTLVTGLAARTAPTALNFILIDFKGGAAFAACERLPHTIGTVTNLDEQLANRALRALQAELERRQRLFTEAGPDVDSLPAYLATGPAEPLPRLLLVIDEFAMLAKDFPEVLDALVSIAAVGRTLGVHMLLATQRPAGVVTEDILANTNLRVALRVQSREDSHNVIGVPEAAALSRADAGRAYVKRGQGDIVQTQTALVTGTPPVKDHAEIDVRVSDAFAATAAAPVPAETPEPGRATDLDLLITAIVEAHAAEGLPAPRAVWPEPLGARVRLSGYAHDPTSLRVGRGTPPQVGGTAGGTLRVGLADEPALQRQSSTGWHLGSGNLLLIGIPGSGTSTALASIALALAQTTAPHELDVMCLGWGTHDLSPLADLPHTTSYAGPEDGERRLRFVRWLGAEAHRRRAAGAPHRKTVVLIDGFSALREDLQDYAGQQLLDGLLRAYADGPNLGLHFAISVTRASAVPAVVDEITTQRWVFRLPDRQSYAALDIRGSDVPAALPGRCIELPARRQMHIATPDFGLRSAVAEAQLRWAQAPSKAHVVGDFPSVVAAPELAGSCEMSSEPKRIPVGIREDTLDPAVIELYEGEHLFISGPARSGKSSLLAALAAMMSTQSSAPATRIGHHGRPTPHHTGTPKLWGIFDRRSPLLDLDLHLDRVASGPSEVATLVEALAAEPGAIVLLVDDAERIADPDLRLESLLSAPPRELTVIAAGRNSELRSGYGHWTRLVRSSRAGVLLQPDIDFDGDLLSVRLPRDSPVTLTRGRGYLCVGGEITLIQGVSTPRGHGTGVQRRTGTG